MQSRRAPASCALDLGDKSSARFGGRRCSSPPWDQHRRLTRTTASIRALARRLQARGASRDRRRAGARPRAGRDPFRQPRISRTIGIASAVRSGQPLERPPLPVSIIRRVPHAHDVFAGFASPATTVSSPPRVGFDACGWGRWWRTTPDSNLVEADRDLGGSSATDTREFCARQLGAIRREVALTVKPWPSPAPHRASHT